MDPPPAEGNFCDNSNHHMEPHNVEQYNLQMSYINNPDHMANRYLMIWCNYKWIGMFFHLLNLRALNFWILLPSCGPKYTHWDFRLSLVRKLIEEAGRSQDRPTPILVGRPTEAITYVMQLNSCHSFHNKHWPANSSKLCCHLCSAHGQSKSMVHNHAKCGLCLWVVPCFMAYHTIVNWWTTRTVISLCSD